MRFLLLAAALLGLAARPQQGINWMKLEQARFMANAKDKLVLAYVACDPGTGMSNCSSLKEAESAFSDPLLGAKRLEQFYFVRIADKKAAQELKATRMREAIFIDGDGDEVHRAMFGDARALDRVMTAALEKYVPREIAWKSYEAKETAAAGEDRKKLVLLGFTDEKKESVEALKALEDRQLAKFQDRFIYMKVPFRKDSEESKKWGVTQAPSMVIVDPAKGDVVERIPARKTVKDLKALLVKALARLEKK